ncbi:MAG: hypothetical protein JEZ06_11245 [Anaerolineaceae bacterium]|nr:hypothetical protein [Anaerolineaceae bacterium]
MNIDSVQVANSEKRFNNLLGTKGHLTLFVWFLVMMLLTPKEKVLYTSLICFIGAALAYPMALRQVFRLRWIALMLLMAIPPIFIIGERDASFMNVQYSSEGWLAGIQIAMRFLVIIIAVQGFTNSVDISALAGLLERFGMQGLGFSLGVALNLLPSLQKSTICTWQTLRMRGGLRKKRRRAFQLLIVTIVTNALQRAEDVALAAEARAFSPEKSRPLPIQQGSMDWMPVAIGLPIYFATLWM